MGRRRRRRRGATSRARCPPLSLHPRRQSTQILPQASVRALDTRTTLPFSFLSLCPLPSASSFAYPCSSPCHWLQAPPGGILDGRQGPVRAPHLHHGLPFLRPQGMGTAKPCRDLRVLGCAVSCRCVRTSVLMRSILRRPTLPLGTQVAQIIDPEQKLFRENIVSRDECGSTWNAAQHSALYMFQG